MLHNNESERKTRAGLETTVFAGFALAGLLLAVTLAAANPPSQALTDWIGPCNNCYNYALNRPGNLPAMPFFAQPPIAGAMTCESVTNAAKANGLAVAAWPGPPAAQPAGWPAGACPEGHCLVALVVREFDPGDPDAEPPVPPTPPDFHWYRLNQDDRWSHKPGMSRATNRDASGNMMGAGNPPHEADVGTYSFCTYMCVPAPPAALANLGGFNEWTPAFLRAYRNFLRGRVPWQAVKDEFAEIGEFAARMPGGQEAEDPMWAEGPDMDDRGYGLAAGPGAHDLFPDVFPPFLKVRDGIVAFYSSIEDVERGIAIEYFIDDKGLEEALAALFVCPQCVGDLNDDGVVGVADLLALLACWGSVVPGCECADLIGNGFVGVGDLLLLLGNWGDCPVPSPCPDCIGDLNGDGVVDEADEKILLECWGPVTPGATICECADLTGDGNVGLPDYTMLLANWGPCP